MRLTFINRLIVGDICQNGEFSRNGFIVCFQHRIYLFLSLEDGFSCCITERITQQNGKRTKTKNESNVISHLKKKHETKRDGKKEKRKKYKCQKDSMYTKKKTNVQQINMAIATTTTKFNDCKM